MNPNVNPTNMFLFPESANKQSHLLFEDYLKQYLDEILSEESLLGVFIEESDSKDSTELELTVYVIIAQAWCFRENNNGHAVWHRLPDLIRYLFNYQPLEQETFDYLLDCLQTDLPFSSLN